MFADERGVLHALKNLPFYPKEILVSKSRKNVLRGLHQSPYAKYLYIVKGSIKDFFWSDGKPTVKVLHVGDTIYVPAGSPHAFVTLEDDNEVVYILDGKFDQNLDKNIYWKDPEFGFDALLGVDESKLVISDKDRSSSYSKQYDYLVLGASGFLGKNCVKFLRTQGRTVLESSVRLEKPDEIREQIRRSGARFVICAAGIAGRPTSAWCDSHETETYQVNYLGVLNLMEACRDTGTHLTVFGSGLVYDGSSASAYTEEDVPNLENRVYSKWRIQLERVLQPNVLYLRILYPCTLDGDPKCFFTKMLGRRDSVHDISTSLTIVPDLFPKIPELVESGTTGILNFVNQGKIKLKDLVKAESTVPGSGGFELSTEKLQTFFEVPGLDALKMVDPNF